MTDIENLKKINKMIPELKKHGFAATSDEAAQQSAEFYQNKYVEETNAEISQVVPEQAVTFDHLERMKAFMSQRLNSIEAQVSTVTAKMNEMIKMINKLEKLQGSTQVQAEPTQRQTVIKEEPKKVNPRSGDFESKDVEIDKIFYFGNK